MTWARLRLAIADRFPFLGPVRRCLVAERDRGLPVRRSYSQHGEDRWLFEELRRWNLDGGCYVDVGSNHPTRISNTYLFYRHGYSGVVIEPNGELLRLHRRVRPRDTCINVGCALEPSLGSFNISTTPVLSYFTGKTDGASLPASRVLRTEHVALLPLDTVMSALNVGWIFFLSIDTEGLDQQVLAGAPETLQRTLFVCVEASSDAMAARIGKQLTSSHDPVMQLGCNLIFRSRHPPTTRLAS
jgi:FkbM family methyltransferase